MGIRWENKRKKGIPFRSGIKVDNQTVRRTDRQTDRQTSSYTKGRRAEIQSNSEMF